MNRVVSGLVVVALLAMLTLDLTFVGFYFYGAFLIIPLAGSPLALVGALLVARVPRNVVVDWPFSVPRMPAGIVAVPPGLVPAIVVKDPAYVDEAQKRPGAFRQTRTARL